MGELFHAGAFASAAAGACCVAVDSGRPRVRELLLAVAMVAAMFDVASGARVLPVVLWSGVLTVLALASAVRKRRDDATAALAHMRVHSALGAVVMAALMLLMTAPATASASVSASHHGGAPGVMTAIIVAAALAHSVAAIPLSRRTHLLGRLQYAAMSLSLLLMTLAVLG